jgi:uncharacterized membrane protein YfcA
LRPACKERRDEPEVIAMPAVMMLSLAAAMVATSFLSGIFGMAGGLILMGLLLALLPLPEAMALHALTQMASNGWRGLLWWRHVRWRPVVLHLLGAATALVVWTLVAFVPSKPLALISLGLSPLLVRLFPARLRPDPASPVHGPVYGALCMTLMLLTGVSGPLLDACFLGGRLDRREIVATKAVCQVFGHGAKLLYFGALIDQAGMLDPLMAALAVVASVAGTTLARPILEMLSDAQYRTWATRLVTAIACAYLAQGGWLLAQATR